MDHKYAAVCFARAHFQHECKSGVNQNLVTLDGFKDEPAEELLHWLNTHAGNCRDQNGKVPERLRVAIISAKNSIE